MKIMLDPYYTGSLHTCATTNKYKHLVNVLLEERDDVFFYWMVPPELDDEEKEFLPVSDRIEYIKTSPPNKRTDRIRGFFTFPYEYERAVAYDGTHWDYDLLITSRSALAASIRAVQFKYGDKSLVWSRKLLIMEDMPLLSFKGWISSGHQKTTDIHTLLGYLAADRVLISAFWEKAEILKIAKNVLSPAKVKELAPKLIECAPYENRMPELKTKEAITPMLEGKAPFTMSFSGRMIAGHNFESIFDVMRKHWVLRGGERLECIVTSQSAGNGAVRPPDFIDVKLAKRDEFWGIVKNRSHVGMFFSPEEDYSMSLMEPIMLGLPVAVYRAPHSVASLGEDYPFFFQRADEAFSIVKAFHDNYPKMYKLFAEWSKTHLTPMIEERNKKSMMYWVKDLLAQWDKDFVDWSQKWEGRDDEIVDIALETADKQNGELLYPLDMVGDSRMGQSFRVKGKCEAQRDGHRASFTIEFKKQLLLLLGRGYRPASVKVGHLKKVLTKGKKKVE